MLAHFVICISFSKAPVYSCFILISSGFSCPYWVSFKQVKGKGGKIKKGDVLACARIAGIMAAKKTSELIPMCHPLSLTHVQVDFEPDETNHCIRIEASVRTIDQTGVEMEALTAVSTAALTIYDMCKSYDRDMTISSIRLLEKSGGKSGTYKREPE